jgi:hypothetical protein
VDFLTVSCAGWAVGAGTDGVGTVIEVDGEVDFGSLGATALGVETVEREDFSVVLEDFSVVLEDFWVALLDDFCVLETALVGLSEPFWLDFDPAAATSGDASSVASATTMARRSVAPLPQPARHSSHRRLSSWRQRAALAPVLRVNRHESSALTPITVFARVQQAFT